MLPFLNRLRLVRSASYATATLLLTAGLGAQTLSPEGRRAILDKTQTIRLAPALDHLNANEREALRHLLAVGAIFQRLYEDSRHPQAAAVRASLADRDAEVATLYHLSQGPVATTVDNQRLPIDVGIAPESPGRNLYPADISAEQIEAFLVRRPELRDEILGERTVVRLATVENLRQDLAHLARYPVVGALQPGLGERLLRLSQQAGAVIGAGELELYAVPYSVAYAAEMVEAQLHLFQAADAIESDDAEFARYLRNRGRDLISNDYESGDAAWVKGRFGRLNAQIGAYETYDDALFGVKAFYSVSLLVRDELATAELRQAIGGLQEIEDALPYEPRKQVQSDIPVGVYEIIADFGQARGINTATILPNDALFTRRYGRTILMRKNILLNPELGVGAERRWRAAVAPAFAALLEPEGGFQRTLWHEIGHYLGPDQARDGRALDLALKTRADSIEEMKSDLVSLFANEKFFAKETISAERHRAVRASGILRTLQDNRPRRDQAYQVMQLAQFNYFLDRGLLKVDAASRLEIDFARYSETVASLLGEVIALQSAGDADKAEAFFARWTAWNELHEALAEKLRAAAGPRFRLMRYAALGE
jgi:hypothetical protein